MLKDMANETECLEYWTVMSGVLLEVSLVRVQVTLVTGSSKC
jgi:hypothetical protein